MGLKKNKFSKLDELKKSIPNLKKAIQDDYIGVYPYKKPYKGKTGEWRAKVPKYINNKSHGKYWNIQPKASDFGKKDNVSFIIGYDKQKRGVHLGALDIDGIKKSNNGNIGKYWYEEEYHKKTCKLLYDVLKNSKMEFISSKTWSGGYHLYFMSTENNFNPDVFDHIYYPEDFEIEELQGKAIGKEIVEVFIKSGQKKILTSPSTIIDKKINEKTGKMESRKGKYQFLEKNDIYNLINNPVDDLLSIIIDVFRSFNFTVDEKAIKNLNHNNVNVNKGNIKEIPKNKKFLNNINVLNDNEKEKVINEIVSIIKKTVGKHNAVIPAIEGALEQYGIQEKEREYILFNAIERSGDGKDEYKRVLSSLSRKGIKTGFPTIEKANPDTKENIEKIKSILEISDYLKSTILDFEYQILAISYNEVINLFKSNGINNDSLEDTELIYLLESIDSYFKMGGLGIYERIQLLNLGSNNLLAKPEEYLDQKIQEEIEIAPPKQYKFEKYDLNTSTGKNKLFEDFSIVNVTIDKIYDFLKHKNLDLNSNFKFLLESKIRYLKFQYSTISNRNNKSLLNLRFKPFGLSNDDITSNAFAYLKNNHHIKKTKSDGDYIFSNKYNKYVKYNYRDLGNLLSVEYGIDTIREDHLKTICGYSMGYSEFDDDILRLEDGFLDTETWKFEETNQLEKIFTRRSYPYYYNTPKEYIITDTENLILESIKKILIPRNNPNDDIRYLDFIERVGSCLNNRNKHKRGTIYYGKGNNGKGLLIVVLELLFKDRVYKGNLKELFKKNSKDNTNKDIWIIDEIGEHDLKNYIEELKNIITPDSKGNEKKRIYEDTGFNDRNPTHVFIFTNNKPSIPINDSGKPLLERLDIIDLCNEFTTTPNKDRNQYLIDSSIEGKIKRSEWVYIQNTFNECLKAYSEKVNNNSTGYKYPLAQSYKETINILYAGKDLETFLNTHYRIDEENRISNKTILSDFTEYCKRRKIEYDIDSTKLGYKIKELFGDIKYHSGNDTYYKLSSTLAIDVY